MRFLAADGSTVHVSYCSNVHPAETAEGVILQLETFAAKVRAQLGSATLGVGLWLSARAAQAFDDNPRLLACLRATLAAHALEVVTFNGFPYGGFHDEVVKHSVYRPDWTTRERAEHTVRLARLLAQLLPDDLAEGAISTLPLGYRQPWGPAEDAAALQQLRLVAHGLDDIEAHTGKRIRLALEPEPGCVLETTTQVTDFLARLAMPQVQACLDAAHLAVAWEEPGAAVAGLATTGIAKAQLATALHVPDPLAEQAFLASHDEPRFLHQVRRCGGGGTDDLPEALRGEVAPDAAWRVHVHLPLHADPRRTTAATLEQVMAELVGGPRPLTRILEVETYTWTVLPEGQRPVDSPGLVTGIVRELEWVRDRLLRLGLTEAVT